MNFIIVRHSETSWNRQRIFQGITNVPLSKIGLTQANLLAKKLSDENIGVIYTSVLKRAIVTAEKIQKFHKKAKIIKTKKLNELSWGIWEGIKLDEVKKRYPELYEKREKDRFNFKIPKGESLKMLKKRIKKFLSCIGVKSEDGAILIVGHLNVNRVLIGTLMGWKDEKTSSINLDNASVVAIKTNKGRAKILRTSSSIENGSMPC